ncbi:VC0807 family protein [Pseudodesulfovibrio sp. zrk46]|uniref:VC0807 family protein n=1 Tax=Pseudodesulfovibrio sp. zrk46 TaxID=2725288 RepID=UPI0014497D33|nr:VC0807 family protein [Pseudodesulfovibrio sp. zrk46]QJB55269.1 hypothetical protein HFN16_02125 [Pseudodesulfovibrio sp. zrk46]
MAYTPVNRILLGAVAPTLIYYVGRKLDHALAGALLASLWGIGVMAWFLLKEKEFDGASGIGAAYAVSELAGLLVTKNPDWFLLSPIVSDWVVGGVFMVSMLTRRPLIQVLAEQMSGKNAFPESIRNGPHYRPLWLRLSLVWGGAYVLKGVFKWISLNTMPVEAYLTLRAGLDWPVIIGLMAFSIWYPRRYWTARA